MLCTGRRLEDCRAALDAFLPGAQLKRIDILRAIRFDAAGEEEDYPGDFFRAPPEKAASEIRARSASSLRLMNRGPHRRTSGDEDGWRATFDNHWNPEPPAKRNQRLRLDLVSSYEVKTVALCQCCNNQLRFNRRELAADGRLTRSAYSG